VEMHASGEKSIIHYTFTMHTGTFTFLSDSISINQGETWDDPNYEVSLPFPFVINGMHSLNFLFFDGLGADVAGEAIVDSIYEYILPFSCDLIDRGFDLDSSLSELSYKVEGTPGNRIFKMEWKNVGSFDEGSPYSMYMNYQLWLYEGSNIIEYHYGPSMISDPFVFYYEESGAYIGLVSWDEVFFDIYFPQFLIGPASAPTLSSMLEAINGTPSNGTIYRFTPITLNVETLTPSNNLIISPNPGIDFIQVKNSGNVDTKIIMMDQTGRVVLSSMVNSDMNTVDISSLASGIYFISAKNQENTSMIKFIKQ